MDIQDFQGLFKYKLILPIIYIVSWIMMFIGPIFIQQVYFYFGMVCITYFVYKCTSLFLIMIRVNIGAQAIFTKMQNGQYNKIQPSAQREEIYFGFIIPNYKQEVEMMADTLQILAKQKRAKQRYLIFLAMQEHQKDSQLKAKQLKQRFKDKFKAVQHTLHALQQFQQKGKASNVSWCAQHLEPFLQKHKIIEQNLFLTIIDADSWAPEPYFEEIQQHIIEKKQQKHLTIFMPPQIFTRNNLDVPIFTRIFDMMHSFAHASNLFSCFNLTFPLSNYTLSYNLAKRVGFWDTCADAIGEDFHMTQKAFWKTQGKIITKPIFICFNQLNIETGRGYLSNMNARFWQGERHAQGCSDLAYNLKMLIHKKFVARNIILMLIVIDTFILPAVLPWIFLSLNIQSLILSKYYDFYTQPQVITLILNIMFNSLTVLTVLSTVTIEVLKRRSNKIIYQKQNECILRVIQYPIFITIVLFLFAIPTFTIAAFRVLISNRQYKTAQKKSLIDKSLTQSLITEEH